MKIKYTCTFKCREHGVFGKRMPDIHESWSCPACGRLSELVEGSFVCVLEGKRIIDAKQHRLGGING